MTECTIKKTIAVLAFLRCRNQIFPQEIKNSCRTPWNMISYFISEQGSDHKLQRILLFLLSRYLVLNLIIFKIVVQNDLRYPQLMLTEFFTRIYAATNLSSRRSTTKQYNVQIGQYIEVARIDLRILIIHLVSSNSSNINSFDQKIKMHNRN